VIVLHVRIQCASDYVARRQPHRQAHIARLSGLRGQGAVIGGGPAPDGALVELVYRLQRPAQLAPVVEEDPYWTGGAWTSYTARSFGEFVEPWELPPIVLDGSRRATVVEGPIADRDMAQFALIELRGAGRLAFGGVLEDGQTWALCRTADGAEAVGWFADTGFWSRDALAARPLLYVI
jgi:uncharacterized protein YciI